MNKNNKGFSLIELMVALAIVAILAAFALPAYQDYTIRAQLSDGVSISGGLQIEIAEYYSVHGSLPQNNEAINTPMPAGKYSYVHNIQNGEIVIFFDQSPLTNAKIKNAQFALEPTIGPDGSIAGWKCGPYALLAKEYLPSSCQDNIDQNGVSGT